MSALDGLPVSLDDIHAAAERLKGHAVKTPLEHFPTLASLCGCDLYLKLETMQRCRAFKFRGALSRISRLPPGSTVVCASAGNHSQGVALSATLCGMTSKIYMPLTAPIAKVNATQGYGGSVVQHGLSFDEALKKCKEDLEEHKDWIFIPPFDDEDVIAGQGTIGLEINEQLKDADTVVVQVGGGGLAAGVAIALRALNPKVRIVAVNAAVRSNFYKKFQEAKGRPVEQVKPFNGVPLADGIAVVNPGTITYPIIEKLVDEFVIVSEDDIAESIALLAERAKIMCEGAGATAFAAIRAKKFNFRPDEKVVCILSGGNIELPMLSRCIDRAMFLWGRRKQFNISLPISSGQYIKMLEILRSYNFEIISSHSTPNADCFANHIRYTITVDIPDARLFRAASEKFKEMGWTINVTELHADDE